MWSKLQLVGIVFFIFFVSCATKDAKQSSAITLDKAMVIETASSLSKDYSGFLTIKSDVVEANKWNLEIFNSDSSLYGVIAGDDTIEPYLNSDKVIGDIHAYYPDYYIIVFKSNGSFSNGLIDILIGGDIKYMEYDSTYMKYEGYLDHLSNNTFVLKSGSLVKKSNLPTSALFELEYSIDDYTWELQTKEGSWLELTCYSGCEGCPGNKKITVWTILDKSLLEFVYGC